MIFFLGAPCSVLMVFFVGFLIRSAESRRKAEHATRWRAGSGPSPVQVREESCWATTATASDIRSPFFSPRALSLGRSSPLLLRRQGGLPPPPYAGAVGFVGLFAVDEHPLEMQGRMRRQGQYGEADINSMVAAQLHHYQTQPRVQQHPENSYSGRDPAQASGEHQYTPPKVRRSPWDRGGPNVPSQVSSYAYRKACTAAC